MLVDADLQKGTNRGKKDGQNDQNDFVIYWCSPLPVY